MPSSLISTCPCSALFVSWHMNAGLYAMEISISSAVHLVPLLVICIDARPQAASSASLSLNYNGTWRAMWHERMGFCE